MTKIAAAAAMVAFGLGLCTGAVDAESPTFMVVPAAGEAPGGAPALAIEVSAAAFPNH